MIEAVMDISSGAFEELKARFAAVGANILAEHEGRPVLVLGSLGLRRENDDNVKCYLVYQGKIVKAQKDESASINGDASADPDAAI